jgi:hypothetical protein
MISQVQLHLLELFDMLVTTNRINPKRPDEVSVGLLLAHEYHLSENFGTGSGSAGSNDQIVLKGSDSVLQAAVTSLDLKKICDKEEEDEEDDDPNDLGMPNFTFGRPVALSKNLQRVQTSLDPIQSAQSKKKVPTYLSKLHCHITPVVIKTEAEREYESTEFCRSSQVYPFSSLEFDRLEAKISQDEYLKKRQPTYKNAMIPFVGTTPNRGALWYHAHKDGKRFAV